MTESTNPWKLLTGTGKGAVVCTVLGFIVSIGSTSTETRNGVVTECSYFDLGALAFGVAGIVLGAMALNESRRLSGRARSLALAIAVGALVLGVVNVLRGLGTLGGPCN